jgi:hypothetical protein
VHEKGEVGLVTQGIREFEGIAVEVGYLGRPVANAKVRGLRGETMVAASGFPIMGGDSIGPGNTSITGTLGCFVSRTTDDGESILFALSANHVLADGDLLEIGTPIVYTTRGGGSTPAKHAFASLSETIRLRFLNDGTRSRFTNRYDAALAAVTARSEDIMRGTIRKIDRYDPTDFSEADEGMKVIKCGMTTDDTVGIVDSINLGLTVMYSPPVVPRLAKFDGVFLVRGADGRKFADTGDSGSVILDEKSRHPVGLLFAADEETGESLACDFGGLCRSLNVRPV